jgi:hypothetical protein
MEQDETAAIVREIAGYGHTTITQLTYCRFPDYLRGALQAAAE